MSGEDGNVRRDTTGKDLGLVVVHEKGAEGLRGPRILVASDCPSVGTLKQDLQRHGYRATVASSGKAVLETHDRYDLVLLDTDLPDLDGVSVCQFVRRRNDVPIIGFTSTRAEVDRVLLLEAGCDDCVDMPYRARELVARIKAVLRRTAARDTTGRAAAPEDDERMRFGPLVIDTVRREARLNGRPVALTRKEFDLLHKLATEPERIFQRQELMSDVWDYPADNRLSVQESRTIDTHVSSLRGKLGNSEWVTTIRGVGFRFGMPVPPPETHAVGSGAACPRQVDTEEPVPLRLIRSRSANGSAPQGPW
ncbi:response regulator transcription factor [Streptomyces sp. CA-294286]|uniref:response regulator transcription factor n=1 Tax=Streptomyces sp. CA-294286 TaxID=3240070 RepID=UPI003D8E28BE